MRSSSSRARFPQSIVHCFAVYRSSAPPRVDGAALLDAHHRDATEANLCRWQSGGTVHYARWLEQACKSLVKVLDDAHTAMSR